MGARSRCSVESRPRRSRWAPPTRSPRSCPRARQIPAETSASRFAKPGSCRCRTGRPAALRGLFEPARAPPRRGPSPSRRPRSHHVPPASRKRARLVHARPERVVADASGRSASSESASSVARTAERRARTARPRRAPTLSLPCAKTQTSSSAGCLRDRAQRTASDVAGGPLDDAERHYSRRQGKGAVITSRPVRIHEPLQTASAPSDDEDARRRDRSAALRPRRPCSGR